MEILRILFALGFLAPGYYAMEIQPSVLPRNLDVYCKFCEGLSAVFDNFSYEDYDFWRTIDIQEKVRFFCSFCKNKTESTTILAAPETTSPSTTTNTSPHSETSPVRTTTQMTSETSETSPVSTTTQMTSETTPVSTTTPTASNAPSSSTQKT